MNDTRADMLVLAMGNDILTDDGVALHAARSLRERLPPGVDLVETSEAGFALLELMLGYDRVLILDALKTGDCAPGTIVEMNPEDFSVVESPSPHYAGLPDLKVLAGRVGIAYPENVSILAMEVADPYSIGEQMSEPVVEAFPKYLRAVEAKMSEVCRPLIN